MQQNILLHKVTEILFYVREVFVHTKQLEMLDISAVPILKTRTHLPVMVDVTHSTVKDIMLPTMGFSRWC